MEALILSGLVGGGVGFLGGRSGANTQRPETQIIGAAITHGGDRMTRVSGYGSYGGFRVDVAPAAAPAAPAQNPAPQFIPYPVPVQIPQPYAVPVYQPQQAAPPPNWNWQPPQQAPPAPPVPQQIIPPPQVGQLGVWVTTHEATALAATGGPAVFTMVVNMPTAAPNTQAILQVNGLPAGTTVTTNPVMPVVGTAATVPVNVGLMINLTVPPGTPAGNHPITVTAQVVGQPPIAVNTDAVTGAPLTITVA